SMGLGGLIARDKGSEEVWVERPEQERKIRCLKAGEGPTTLLFVAGWCINGDFWQAQMQAFQENYTVVAVDLPGFGKSVSGQGNWTISEYADDLLAVINALKLKNVILIGHSMSGDVVLEAAVRDPQAIKGVIGIDTFKFVGEQPTPEMMAGFQVFLENLKTDFQTTALAYAQNSLFHLSTPQAVQEQVLESIRNTDPEAGYVSLANLFQYMAMEEGGALGKLSFPLNLINSDALPTATGGLEASCANGFRLLEIPATGHYPMLEKPEAFNQLLAEALKGITADKTKQNREEHLVH
nr:alpha/beta hydrolase [Calditrichia bacterium]